MATKSQIRGIKNLSKLRQKLKRMPEQVEKHIRPVMERVSADIALDMRGLTPVSTAEAVLAIDHKVGPDGMSAKIGIRTKTKAKKAFYFAFIDAGTKGDPSKSIPPLPALHIRERAFDANKNNAMREFEAATDKALVQAINE